MPSLMINLTIALKALTQNKLQALLTLCGMSGYVIFFHRRLSCAPNAKLHVTD